MYTKEDVIKFGKYLLSEARAKRLEATLPQNDLFVALSKEISEDDFDAVWPPIQHELTQEDLDVNGPITDADGNAVKAEAIVEIPTAPDTIVDVPSEN